MDLRERPTRDFVRHPWETARSRFFVDLLARSSAGSPGRILDAGSGDSWFASQLAARLPGAEICCWDRSYTPELISSLGATAPKGVTLCAARPRERFDHVVLLDVLEHVEDDRAFLDELVRENLAPGGRLLVSVPAWPSLFGEHDRRLGHHRRYRQRDCHALLRGAGLRIRRSGGLFYTLLPPRWLAVRAERRHKAPGGTELAWRQGAASARWVHRWLRLDAVAGEWASRLRLGAPGLSCWALCERPR